jgi:cyanophycinase-like exopeptidase
MTSKVTVHDPHVHTAHQRAGLLALVGGDEFHAGNEPHDALLAASAHGPAYVVATAAARSRPEMTIRNAQAWFRRFGLDVVELAVYTKTTARDAKIAESVAGAGFCYLPGGDPGLVASLLRDSPVGSAIVTAWRNGAALAGSSAGAMGDWRCMGAGGVTVYVPGKEAVRAVSGVLEGFRNRPRRVGGRPPLPPRMR